VAYAAGFFDGEGCVTTAPGTSVRATISNTNRPILDWFQLTFRGSVNNQHLPANPKHNVAWKWVLVAKPDVLGFLECVRPYLRVKATEADAAIEFLRKWPKRRAGRPAPAEQGLDFEALRETLRKLKSDRHFDRSERSVPCPTIATTV
jgi:hypothetical protein